MAEAKLYKPNAADLAVVKKIEGLLGRKLKQTAEIEWNTRGYTVAQGGAVSGLGFWNCGIGSDKLKPLAGLLTSLTNLTELDLGSNKLTYVPRELFERFQNVVWGVGVGVGGGVNLYGNPLESPPVEIVKQGREAIDRYFRQLRKSEAKTEKEHYLFEAKLLIIGEAGSGKTTFARKIKDPDAEMPAPEDTTRGIDVHTWSFEVTGEDFPKLNSVNIDRTMFYLNL